MSLPLACANCTPDGCACERKRRGEAPSGDGARSGVGSFSLLAYRRDDPFDGGHDLRRTRLPLTRLDAAVRWALQRGCDTILIELGDDPAIRDRGVTHHVCSDAACPGGC